MSDPSLEAEVAAANAYEALFVPALFGQWASRVADAAKLLPGQRVLDVGCGTGVLAREALLRTGPTGYVAGLDPSNGMLAVARTRAADALRAPFVLGDRTLLAEVFNDAGASAVTIATLKGVAQFPSIRVMVEADLRGWLPVMGVNLPEKEISRILAEAEDALHSYVTDAGRVRFDAPAHLVTAGPLHASGSDRLT